MVYRLHQCHVIHADIKPDNIMIMDIRSVQYHIWGNCVYNENTYSNNVKCAKLYIQDTILLLMYIVIHVL